MSPDRLLDGDRWRILAIGLSILAILWAGQAPGQSETEPRAPNPTASPTLVTHRPNGYPGTIGRTGHIAFPTFGRRDSITHVEVMPFVIVDNDMLFGDARLFVDNEGRFGSNAGLGLRRWVPGWERALGGSLWLDYDEGSGEPFQQVGLSLETLGEHFDVRANGYVPIGQTEHEYFTAFSNLRYAGNQIIVDSLRKFSEAQPGFDLELALALPSEFAAERNMRAVGGYYHFLGDEVPDIDGYKARLEGSLTERIDLQVEFTDDNAFGTNMNFGVAYHFGGSSHRSPDADPMLRQMTRYVRRNYNVIAGKRADISVHQPAINPVTGRPYVVQHVSSLAAGTGSGTPSDPFGTIAQAQSSGADLILVHSGSVLNSPIVLAPGQRILGEGVDHLINIQGAGNVLLPAFTGGSVLPVVQGVSGDAVVLATGSEFSGFVIDGAAGAGIIGNQISAAIVRNVTVQNALGDGVFLSEATGTVLFENLHVTGTGGTAFHLVGGAADVAVSGFIANSTGRAVWIENTTGGSVHLEHASITDVGGMGILLSNNAGNVSFGNVTIENSTSTGIDIQGGSGTTQFIADTTIIDPAGPAIRIENAASATNLNRVTVTSTTGAEGVRVVNSPGTTTISDLNLSTTGGTGLVVQNSGEFGLFAGSIQAAGATAVDIEGTRIDIDLARISSSNAAHGIRIVDSPGAFVVRGDGTAGSGGLIQGAGIGVLAQNSGGVALQNMVLDANGTGISASNLEGLLVHQGQITNSTSQAVDLLNVKQFELFDSALTGNAAGVRGRFDAVADYEYTFSQNEIDSPAGAAVVLSTLPSGEEANLSLNFEANTITLTAAGSQALDLDWTGGLSANLTGNTITASGANSTGFDLNAGSATADALFAIGQNTLTFAGDDSAGLRLATAGPLEIALGENTTVFNAARGIGADFNLAGESTVDIFDNRITDNVSSGTGLLFSSIAGPSTVTIDNNTIELLSADALTDRGIVFGTVTGNVQLEGTESNTITGAEEEFIPGGTTGQIIINGAPVP